RANPLELPDLVAIGGRSDRCLILCGTNISEGMLDEAMKASDPALGLTGRYKAELRYDQGRQRLALKIERRAAAQPDAPTDRVIYNELVRTLGRVQPEFMDDWRNVYQRWDDDPKLRILQLEYVAWPELSQLEPERIKHSGLAR